MPSVKLLPALVAAAAACSQEQCQALASSKHALLGACCQPAHRVCGAGGDSLVRAHCPSDCGAVAGLDCRTKYVREFAAVNDEILQQAIARSRDGAEVADELAARGVSAALGRAYEHSDDKFVIALLSQSEMSQGIDSAPDAPDRTDAPDGADTAEGPHRPALLAWRGAAALPPRANSPSFSCSLMQKREHAERACCLTPLDLGFTVMPFASRFVAAWCPHECSAVTCAADGVPRARSGAEQHQLANAHWGDEALYERVARPRYAVSLADSAPVHDVDRAFAEAHPEAGCVSSAAHPFCAALAPDRHAHCCQRTLSIVGALAEASAVELSRMNAAEEHQLRACLGERSAALCGTKMCDVETMSRCRERSQSQEGQQQEDSGISSQ